ncbi:hypothetical protein CI710_11640 [Aeromonas salmonicida]|nr:hypothetical protein CI710_11640 [Aeromonas salmonicida]RSM27047.1 hypothetical protein C5B78_11865 [Aeromonas salmonicida]
MVSLRGNFLLSLLKKFIYISQILLFSLVFRGMSQISVLNSSNWGWMIYIYPFLMMRKVK